MNTRVYAALNKVASLNKEAGPLSKFIKNGVGAAFGTNYELMRRLFRQVGDSGADALSRKVGDAINGLPNGKFKSIMNGVISSKSRSAARKGPSIAYETSSPNYRDEVTDKVLSQFPSGDVSFDSLNTRGSAKKLLNATKDALSNYRIDDLGKKVNTGVDFSNFRGISYDQLEPIRRLSRGFGLGNSDLTVVPKSSDDLEYAIPDMLDALHVK